MLRWWRRRERARVDAREEVEFLKRRHGARALEVARQRLASGVLTSWGRRVIGLAIAALLREERRRGG